MSPPEDTWMVGGEASKSPWGPGLLSFYCLTASQDIVLRCLARLIGHCEYLIASVHCSLSAVIGVLKIMQVHCTSWGGVWALRETWSLSRVCTFEYKMWLCSRSQHSLYSSGAQACSLSAHHLSHQPKVHEAGALPMHLPLFLVPSI